MLKYYLFNQIPGVWKDWTLAVFATGQQDADEYMRNQYHGGKRAGVVEPGPVKADCGAVTSAASAILSERMAKDA